MASIPELLRGRVTLEVECLGRLYLNGYIGPLATAGGLVTFMREQLGKPIPSPVVLGQVTEKFRDAVKAMAERQQIPIYPFDHKERKDDVANRIAAPPGDRIAASLRRLPGRPDLPGRPAPADRAPAAPGRRGRIPVGEPAQRTSGRCHRSTPPVSDRGACQNPGAIRSIQPETGRPVAGGGPGSGPPAHRVFRHGRSAGQTLRAFPGREQRFRPVPGGGGTGRTAQRIERFTPAPAGCWPGRGPGRTGWRRPAGGISPALWRTAAWRRCARPRRCVEAWK